MASKRASSTVAHSKAKAPKTAKAEQAEPVDPFLAECSEVVSALDEVGAMPDGARELLKVVAPHSLRTPKAERHEYQEDMIKLLSKAFQGLETSRREAVTAGEARVERAAASKSESLSELAAADATVTEKQEANKAKSQALKEAEAAVSTALAGLEGERRKVSELLAAHEARVAGKASLERVVTEIWEPLKARSFAGKEWRQRDKAIDALMQAMCECSLDASLQKALPVALKTKSGEERGPFAEKALQAGEEALQARLEQLSAEIANAGAEATEQAAAVAAAEAAHAAAVESAAAATEASIAADNEQLAAGEAARLLREKIPQLDEEATQAAEELDAAGKHLAGFLEIAARFARLEEGVPAVAAEPAHAGA